jgi:hypothetical protein
VDDASQCADAKPIPRRQPCPLADSCPVLENYRVYTTRMGSCSGSCGSTQTQVRDTVCVNSNSTEVNPVSCSEPQLPDWTTACFRIECLGAAVGVPLPDTPDKNNADTSKVAIIIGASVGGVVVVGCIIGAVIFVQRRKVFSAKEAEGRNVYRSVADIEPSSWEEIAIKHGDIVVQTTNGKFKNERTGKVGAIRDPESALRPVDRSRLMLVSKRQTMKNRMSLALGLSTPVWEEKK